MRDPGLRYSDTGCRVNPNSRCPSLLFSLRAIGIDNSMWSVPYIYFLIFVFCPSWYQTVSFGLLCALLVFFVIWTACRLHLRTVARAIRARDEQLFEQTRITREHHENMLQTVQGSRFVAQVALEKSDPAHMRGTLKQLTNWLGQATQEAQAALNSLPTPKIKKDHD